MDYFKDLYAGIDQDDPIDEYRQELTDAIDEIIYNFDDYNGFLEELSEIRGIDTEILRRAKCFFLDIETPIESLPKVLLEDRSDFVSYGTYLRLGGRVVFPIMDLNDHVMGFTGWSGGSRPKYMNSNPYGFLIRHGTFLNMNNLVHRNSNYIIVTEGIFDSLYIQSCGVDSIAANGSILNKTQVISLSLIEDQVIFIPDPDKAGRAFAKQVKRVLPKAKVYLPTGDTDLDNMRKEIPEVDKDIIQLGQTGRLLSRYLKGV